MIIKRTRVYPQWAMPEEVVQRTETMAEAAGMLVEDWLEWAIRRQAAIDAKVASGRAAIRRFNGDETTELTIGE